MKLLYCSKCHDIIRLVVGIPRKCACGATSGKYINKLDAVYSGEYAVPLGIDNHDFLEAILNRPTNGLGELFTAFVIPKDCPTFKKVDSI